MAAASGAPTKLRPARLDAARRTAAGNCGGPSLRPMFFTIFEALNMDTRDERFVSVHEMTRGTQNKHT